MGYIRHDAIIAVTSAYEKVNEVIEEFRTTLPERWQRLLVGPIASVTNEYSTWVFAPDGSKEGWADSHDGDKYRYEFLQLIKHKCYNLVSVRFGGDDSHITTITNESLKI